MAPKDFKEKAKNIGLVIAGQTGNMAPCDKKLYALRDVTATVDCMPLIASSIMSKKLAAGAKNIVLDVKCGDGAFMKNLDDASKLANEMVSIGKRCGRNVTALITDMTSPLGYTLLAQGATWQDIKAICDDAVKYNAASVCIPPAYVKPAKEYVGGKIKICTVIGFPNGYNTTEVKCFETADAVKNGADEIDMVINIGMLKDKRYDDILFEINEIKKACDKRVLKVIIETCLLTDEEKIKMCEIIDKSNANYIKTSTGFSTGGATFDDVKLMSEHIKNKKIKAAGGIKSFDDAEKFISLGANRLGTSRLIKIMKEG
jgi:deoxyribose-phosphate aldolase